MFAQSFSIRTTLLASAAVLPMVCGGAAFAQNSQSADTASGSSKSSVQEVVVTATRRAENVSKVPQSITAYTEQKLDKQGVKTIDDITRLTPGLSRTVANSTSVISFRGVASSVGTSTTGVYIDDTPVQSRALAFFYSSPYPSVFDLSRVEVLRGPQGTLFGAGSEGGTIRFIFPTPSFTSYSGFGRAEVSTTNGGGISYEGGLAAGGPIIEDKLAFRADIFRRRDGGWIDFKSGSFTYPDATNTAYTTGNAGPGSLIFHPNQTITQDGNWTDTTSSRLALSWKPIPGMTITPSIFFQNSFTYDQTASFLAAPSATNYGASQFTNLQNVPTVDANHIALPGFIPTNFPLKDNLTLPALKIDWDLGPVELVSNTSYLNRLNNLWSDYTQSYETSYAARKFPAAGDYVASDYQGKQENIDQEIRVQNTDPGARLKYVVGVFFSDEKQLSNQTIYPNFLGSLSSYLGAKTGGAPFYGNTPAYINYYGEDLVNGMSYFGQLNTHDIQTAAFTQLDFKVTDKLTLTAGVREAYFRLGLNALYTGPSTNTNAAAGKPCPGGIGACTVGAAPFIPASTISSSVAYENSVTPKFALAYQLTPTDLLYASASKGFRPGGAQQLLPSTCSVQLAQYGFVNAQGVGVSPTSYQSDSLWSYEVGAKDQFWGGKIQTAASAYYVDWSNIQTSVRLSSCNQTLNDNLGHATAKGGDLQVHYQVLPQLGLDAIVGYTESSFNNSVVLNGLSVYTKGSAIPGSPAPWQVTLSGEYDFDLPHDYRGYIRADDTYNTAQRPTNTTDPHTTAYIIGLQPIPATNLFNTRLGFYIHDAEVNVFANNLFNAYPSLALSRQANQPMWTDYTFRPRTVGMQVVYRYN